MNYSELIKEVAEKADISQKHAKYVIDTLFSVIEESLKNLNDIRIKNFGKFYRSRLKRKKAKVFNSKVIDIDVYVIKFKPSQKLKDKINNR